MNRLDVGAFDKKFLVRSHAAALCPVPDVFLDAAANVTLAFVFVGRKNANARLSTVNATRNYVAVVELQKCWIRAIRTTRMF